MHAVLAACSITIVLTLLLRLLPNNTFLYLEVVCHKPIHKDADAMRNMQSSLIVSVF